MALHGRSILVVEDEAMIALDLQYTLAHAGADVVMAGSLEEAFAVIDARQWSAAVLDYTLADGDCNALCDWMIRHGVPFVVSTGHQVVEGSCLAGVQLTKPIDASELIEAISDLLNRCAARAS